MTVFKGVLKVLWSCRIMVIIYTVILLVFGAFNQQTGGAVGSFTASRPDIAVVNRDDGALAAGLTDYLSEQCKIADLGEDEETLHDALFYREISYILYIPAGYSEELLAGAEPELSVRSVGDSGAALAETLVTRYLTTARACAAFTDDSSVLTERVESVLKQQAVVETTAESAGALENAVRFYNFAAYSILGGCVYVICMVLASFQNRRIRMRTAVSGMSLRQFNARLLLSNGVFALAFCLLYILLSIVLVGDGVRTAQGLILMLNILVFTVSALTLAFLIGNLVSDRNAIGGIVNVVALGASFLCGVFVPMEWLPDGVLKAAHLLPAYWYVRTNELLKTAPAVDAALWRAVLSNMAVILAFAALFSVLALLAAKRAAGNRRG